ncbi:hypothetical protein PLICRDRAFT_46379 [Plicaturopsis crispa FD-325 SS-3]|uniref:Uncharacterized protein n=1 Tax=Plicaturopsis crispa FD-325 SS-3 TaxID=944288 RepID=A0A0C9T793_PLICR|nr:hypothetical protein PLICRDRAFT_46379 [Plicaturopsis crispa FD-325 SS-3]
MRWLLRLELFTSCAALELSLKVMQLVAQSVVLLIFVLRTYALYGCSRKVLVSLSSLALAVVIGYAFLIVWTMIFSIQNWDDFDGISFTGMSCLELMESPSWIFWLGLFIFDIVVLVMTLAKTYKVSRELRATPKRMPLASLMLRDGSIYFVMMAVLHLANIVPSLAELWSQPPDMLEFFTSLIFYDIGSISGPLSILTNCVSVTLTSRLMLNLHEHAHAGVLSTGAEADASLVSGIIFRDLGPTHRPQSDEYALANLDGLEISRQAEDNDYIPPMEIMEPLLMDDDIARVSHV